MPFCLEVWEVEEVVVEVVILGLFSTQNLLKNYFKVVHHPHPHLFVHHHHLVVVVAAVVEEAAEAVEVQEVNL